jgi:iron complex transport system substrate-binding protein
MKRLFHDVFFCCVVALATMIAAEPPSSARRIVSLVPAVTEMLFAVGAGPQVVGVSSFDREPVQVAALPRVGALLDPDLERILSLRPDMVVAYGTQEDLHRQLARAGIPVFSYKHGGLAGITETIQRVGERTGHVEAANALVRDIEADLTAARTRVASQPRPKVLLVFGRDPDSLRNVFASGGIGFLHDVLELAGGTNVLSDVRREGLQISVEQILAKRPEVILELRAEADADLESKTRKVWRTLAAVPAVRDRRVHVMTGSEMVVPGPRIARAAERIARLLHPSVKPVRP